MAINLGEALSYLDVPQTGIGSVQLPTAKPFMPEYNVEFDIDDTGNIGLGSYLKEFGDTAKEGIGTLADKGLSLFDDSRKSNLMRAGLGSVLFGFSPLTAILGAIIGAKTPRAFDYFQQQEDRRAEEEAERLRQIDLEEKRRLASRIRSGGGTIDSGSDGGYGGTGGEGPSAVGSSGMLGGGV
tara:strand:- start:44 stop:592 length:549 start_codon:yes stop_codon:yes gene_type:complete